MCIILCISDVHVYRFQTDNFQTDSTSPNINTTQIIPVAMSSGTYTCEHIQKNAHKQFIQGI